VIVLACYIVVSLLLAQAYPHARIVKEEFPDGEVYGGSIGWIGLPLPFLGLVSENEQPFTGHEKPDQTYTRRIVDVEFNAFFFAIDASLLLAILFRKRIWRYFSGQSVIDRLDAVQ